MAKIIRGLVLELKPDNAQKLLLDKHLNDCRFIYNKYVEEYLIVFKEFVEICKKYDLYLEEKQNFTKFYNEYIKIEQYKRLSNKMLKDLNNVNIKQQWDIIQLYTMFSSKLNLYIAISEVNTSNIFPTKDGYA